jgi:hypothetical protein
MWCNIKWCGVVRCHFAKLQQAQLKLGTVTAQLLTLWSPGSDASEDEKEKVSKQDLGDFK